MSEVLNDCAGQSEVASGNLFIRKVRLARAGEQVGGHTHNFDHTTIFLRGRVSLHTFDPECGCKHDYECKPGDHFLTKATVIHELTALEDDCEFWCVFPYDGTQASVV